jgi:hypothetical protein
MSGADMLGGVDTGDISETGAGHGSAGHWKRYPWQEQGGQIHD